MKWKKTISDNIYIYLFNYCFDKLLIYIPIIIETPNVYNNGEKPKHE